MLKINAVVLGVCLGAIIGCEAFLGDSIPDNQWARNVFSLVDTDNSSSLSHSEVSAMYARFDQNGNDQVDTGEFVKMWRTDEIGDTASALRMFHNLDSDKDGVLSKDPDLSRSFGRFDRDGNGAISKAEFVITWTKMSMS